jgi:two-component sensor histidine kinase
MSEEQSGQCKGPTLNRSTLNLGEAHASVWPHRVRTYLVLFALALTVPLLALAVFALDRMASIEEAQLERRVVEAARDLAADIDRELDRAIVTLETLATSAELARGDFRAFHKQALLALKRTRAAIVVVDRSYQQLVDTLNDFGTALPPTADPDTAQRVIDSRRWQISNLFKGSISGRPVFNVEVPVLDAEDQVRYVLIMSFQAAHLVEVMKKTPLEAPWITGITDNKGVILARSERHDDFVGKPLPPELLEQSRTATNVYRTTSIAGERILRATIRSELAGWLVSATVPVSHVEAPRRRGYLFASLLLGTAVILGAVLAYMFGRFMARPLDAATRVAAAVGHGDDVNVAPSALTEANLLMETLGKASAELKRRQEHADLLMRELAHRAKNQLAVVKGMALQTARQSESVPAFMAQFGRRLQGLAQSQDVLVRQNWKGARLGELARAHLELFATSDRTEIAGPELFLDATAVQNIGFALHELATNASKHGALSAPQGRVAVRWDRSEAGRIRLDWIESGGPGVTVPLKKGFGHRVIMELVPNGLQGSSTLELTASGLHWRLEFSDLHALDISNAVHP